MGGIVSRWVRIVRIEHHVRRYMSSPRYCSSGCFPHLFLRCSASLLLSPCPSGVQALLPPLLPPPRRGDGPTCPATARRSIWAILPVRVFRPLLPPPHRCDGPTSPATARRTMIRHRQRSRVFRPLRWVFRPLQTIRLVIRLRLPHESSSGPPALLREFGSGPGEQCGMAGDPQPPVA